MINNPADYYYCDLKPFALVKHHVSHELHGCNFLWNMQHNWLNLKQLQPTSQLIQSLKFWIELQLQLQSVLLLVWLLVKSCINGFIISSFNFGNWNKLLDSIVKMTTHHSKVLNIKCSPKHRKNIQKYLAKYRKILLLRKTNIRQPQKLQILDVPSKVFDDTSY